MKFSIIIPVFNEEDNLDIIYKNILQNCDKYNFKILFVDDGSKDKSLDIIKKISSNDDRVEYISFSKNFGQQIAIFAGLENASGDFVVTMDADMQHPPKIIEAMINKYKEGFDIVQTIKTEQMNISFHQKFLKSLFYYIFNKISEINLPSHSSDFRLISRLALNYVNKYQEKEKFLRGIIQNIGFNYCEIKYDVGKRDKGQAVSVYKLFKLALSGIYSFSSIPLIIPFFIGIILFILLILIILFTNSIPFGLNYIILFLFSIQFIFIGIIGGYLSKVFNQTKGRPNYIISEIKLKEKIDH